MYGPLRAEPIKEAVAKYFNWVMLSHRWETKEPLDQGSQGQELRTKGPIGPFHSLVSM
ncbi:hypothetical protein DFJ58DRAFT_796464 [Suillus subalutaceus]|uniref:uncharacterized protein n=1 Tax=Suillus subalutaceus TaxID=48586 RepID=UPI001B885ADD|nr:uncharacterized protein DFJ58DRAFT_796464 [Suillus subalutaceus]KAG1848309.1 hypothetical protein DFJ58DRAFT_796464 [Suillus subalutaceus]